MKFPWTCLVAIVCQLLSYAALGASPLEQEKMSTFPGAISEAQIEQRINNLNSPIDIQVNPAVIDYVKDYVIYGQRPTQQLLGRTALYFPIFEHYLKVNRLPEQLKYLPIIESQLKPNAESPVGALGLWQFTSATARQYHLDINEHVDERRDPIRSTEAAVAYLADLYGKYHDWALVLAAYNCGPARLNQAIRMAGVKDYWKVREYLPTESQLYVPRFIAATYLMHYYQDHGLVPVYPSYELQLSRTVKIHSAIDFRTIANMADVSVAVIERLNPGYYRQFIPANRGGHYLILPEAAMNRFKQNDQLSSTTAIAFNGVRNQTTHLVGSGDTLETLAKRFNCKVSDIQYWNNLTQKQLYFRQEIVIMHASTLNNGWRS